MGYDTDATVMGYDSYGKHFGSSDLPNDGSEVTSWTTSSGRHGLMAVVDDPLDNPPSLLPGTFTYASRDPEGVQRTVEALPDKPSAQVVCVSHDLNDETMFLKAQQLFIISLRGSPNVELWKLYLTSVCHPNTGTLRRETVRQSYVFALIHVGQDKEAGETRNDYIHFLKAAETSSTWEEQEEVDALRKAYHKAVQIPLVDVERIGQRPLRPISAGLPPRSLRLISHWRIWSAPHESKVRVTAPLFVQVRRSRDGWGVGEYLKWEGSKPLDIEEEEKLAYSRTNSIPNQQDETLAILMARLEANPARPLSKAPYPHFQPKCGPEYWGRLSRYEFAILMMASLGTSVRGVTPPLLLVITWSSRYKEGGIAWRTAAGANTAYCFMVFEELPPADSFDGLLTGLPFGRGRRHSHLVDLGVITDIGGRCPPEYGFYREGSGAVEDGWRHYQRPTFGLGQPRADADDGESNLTPKGAPNLKKQQHHPTDVVSSLAPSTGDVSTCADLL
ncbi:hypothetical protein NMY22_g11841 [Coprinellus aureogranulatus]|nr:hypothetical protein NMY22_g11841 [Coprinellus aureogranulatus]